MCQRGFTCPDIPFNSNEIIFHAFLWLIKFQSSSSIESVLFWKSKITPENLNPQLIYSMFAEFVNKKTMLWIKSINIHAFVWKRLKWLFFLLQWILALINNRALPNTSDLLLSIYLLFHDSKYFLFLLFIFSPIVLHL